MLPPKFPYDPNSHRDVVKELMTLSGDDKFKGAIIETKRDWEYEINNTNVREWAKGKLSHPNAGDRLESYKRLMQIWMTLRARKRKVLHPFQIAAFHDLDPSNLLYVPYVKLDGTTISSGALAATIVGARDGRSAMNAEVMGNARGTEMAWYISENMRMVKNGQRLIVNGEFL